MAEPINREKYDRMMAFFSQADNEDELDQVMTLFVFDKTYDRSDILLAEKMTKKAKGWK